MNEKEDYVEPEEAIELISNWMEVFGLNEDEVKLLAGPRAENPSIWLICRERDNPANNLKVERDFGDYSSAKDFYWEFRNYASEQFAKSELYLNDPPPIVG